MAAQIPDPNTGLKERSSVKTKKPDMYRVILHNDHYTTQEFVVEVLVTIFAKPRPIAVKIMLDVHRKGRGDVGVYTYDIAETKASEARRLAADRGFPLKCSVEPE